MALALRVDNRARKSLGICTGTLIRPDVLGTQSRRVIAVQMHPSYGKDGDNPNYDIGLVRFSGGLPAGHGPIRILADRRLLKSRMSVHIAG